MIKLIILNVVIVSAAFSSFLDGEWIGEGSVKVVSFAGEDKNHCDLVSLNIKHTNDLIHLKEGLFDCENDVSKNLEEFSTSIKGKSIVYGGMNIGKIEGKTLKIKYEDFFSGTALSLTAELKEDGLLHLHQVEESMFYDVVSKAVLELKTTEE